VILDEVTVVPGSAYNLVFSLTRILNRGKIETDGEVMMIVCQDVTIRFDHRIESTNGFLLAAKYESMDKQTATACTAVTKESKFQAKDLHGRLGHVNEDYMRLTARHMGWKSLEKWTSVKLVQWAKPNKSQFQTC
jgi:hypothetical protein